MVNVYCVGSFYWWISKVFTIWKYRGLDYMTVGIKQRIVVFEVNLGIFCFFSCHYSKTVHGSNEKSVNIAIDSLLSNRWVLIKKTIMLWKKFFQNAYVNWARTSTYLCYIGFVRAENLMEEDIGTVENDLSASREGSRTGKIFWNYLFNNNWMNRSFILYSHLY